MDLTAATSLSGDHDAELIKIDGRLLYQSVRELLMNRGDAGDSVRVLAELWWRAVYSRPADVAASVASAT